MALLGAFIDSRTSTAITSGSTGSYAHGLPASPDLVVITPLASIASSTNWWNAFGLWDATNVSFYNAGGANSPTVRAVAMVFHSIIR